MMKQESHQERKMELEKVFQQNQANAMTIKNNQDKILSQAQLVEMSGMLFEMEPESELNTTPQVPDQTQFSQMPMDLQQAQQAVQQAHQQLLNENQQLQQALYQLHQVQEQVKQCQYQVQMAQQDVQVKQATANAIVNSLK